MNMELIFCSIQKKDYCTQSIMILKLLYSTHLFPGNMSKNCQLGKDYEGHSHNQLFTFRALIGLANG